MKKMFCLLAAAVLALPITGLAEEKKPKAYTLKTCLVSDEELGSMGY